MIAAEFQLTGEDYTEALGGNFHKAFVARIRLLGMILVIGLILYMVGPAKEYLSIPLLMLLGVNFLLTILLRSGALHRIRANRIGRIHFEAGYDGVIYRTSRGEIKTKWEELKGWRESEGGFLLYIQSMVFLRRFLLVPKRALKTEQVTALRELLSGRVQ